MIIRVFESIWVSGEGVFAPAPSSFGRVRRQFTPMFSVSVKTFAFGGAWGFEIDNGCITTRWWWSRLVSTRSRD